MSDLGRGPIVSNQGRPAPGRSSGVGDERWRDLVAQMGAEIAAPLTAALERINALTGTGKIDRAGLRALREEVETARQAGMIGQQLTRFASGRLRQSHERLQLADVLSGVIAHRARESTARGIVVKPSLQAVEVVVDPSLLFSVLNSTLDWALASAASQIDLALETTARSPRVLLTCRFAHRPVDASTDGPGATAPRGLDSLVWRLLEQTAWAMGLSVERRDEGATTTLALEFARAAGRAAEPTGAPDVTDGFAPSNNSQPLAGSHVLVIASRRELRTQIRDALRNMGLIIDFVNSVDEAAAFCSEGLPHAVVIESIQAGGRFAGFRGEIVREVPDFAFIEIVEEGSTFEMSDFSGDSTARVGRAVLAGSLPSALMYELSRGF